MDKPWLKSYPEGTPATIDFSEFSSLGKFFESKANEFAARPAVHNMGTTLTYAELDARSLAVASYLQQTLGLNKGDRVGLMLPNVLQFPIVFMGVQRAGLVAVNLNPLLTARELQHKLDDSEASALFILENFAHLLSDTQPGHLKACIVTGIGDQLNFPKSKLVNFYIRYVKPKVLPYKLKNIETFNEVIKQGKKLQLKDVLVGPSDIALLQYTGGTTGVAKAAMLSHQNMIANMVQIVTWLLHTSSGKGKIEKGKEIIITALPLYHIFALTANLLTFTCLGGMNYLITNPRDMRGFVKELKSSHFTCITGVNTLFDHLIDTVGFDEVDFGSLKVGLGGGAAIQSQVAERWRKATGSVIVEAYGLTESSPAVTINPINLPEFSGNIGLPLPSTDCCVKDDEGESVSEGEAGELYVRGPQVMQGYWRNPEETKAVLTADGWLRTGDIVKIDGKGFITIVDRKKDLIIVSGFNVYPNEVEEVVSQHPDVLECGVVGVADTQTGETVKLVVIPKNKALTVSTLKAYCHENLMAYKRPKHIKFVEEIPKTPVGKVLRRELKEL